MMSLGHGMYGPQGHRGVIYIATHKKLKALSLVVSEKNIVLCLSHCKFMGANDPQGGATFESRGMIGRIYVKLHITMLHTKY